MIYKVLGGLINENTFVILLSTLFNVNSVMALQLVEIERPSLAMPKGVVGQLRNGYPYKKAEEICYAVNDKDKWALFENELKTVLKNQAYTKVQLCGAKAPKVNGN